MAIPIPTFAPLERPVKVFRVQTERGGHVLGPEEMKLLGTDQGLKPKWVKVQLNGRMAATYDLTSTMES